MTMTGEPRRLEELTPHESMRLLGTVSLGRVAFTARALPAIRPVNHLIDGDDVIIRTDGTASITVARVVGTGAGSGVVGGRRALSRPRRRAAPTVFSTTTRSGAPPSRSRSR